MEISLAESGRSRRYRRTQWQYGYIRFSPLASFAGLFRYLTVSIIRFRSGFRRKFLYKVHININMKKEISFTLFIHIMRVHQHVIVFVWMFMCRLRIGTWPSIIRFCIGTLNKNSANHPKCFSPNLFAEWHVSELYSTTVPFFPRALIGWRVCFLLFLFHPN